MKNMSVKFNLNSLNFVKFASISWKCTLKIIKIELELLTDVEMMPDYENAIGGVITRAICHYGEANNKYMRDYDETKECIFIQYLEFNSHYGWTLSEPITYDWFEYFEDILLGTATKTVILVMYLVRHPEYLQPLHRDLKAFTSKKSNS